MIENQKARIGQSVKFQAELPSEETQIEWFVGEFMKTLILVESHQLYFTTHISINNFFETTVISILN